MYLCITVCMYALYVCIAEMHISMYVCMLSMYVRTSVCMYALNGGPEPTATPMSAALSAGASFTPSPVIATTCPAWICMYVCMYVVFVKLT